jgi:hypothetical protein
MPERHLYLEGQTEGEGEKRKKNSDGGSSWRFLAVDPLQEAASSCLRQQMANHVAMPTLVQSELSLLIRPISSSHLHSTSTIFSSEYVVT